jgi:hypothetical protein
MPASFVSVRNDPRTEVDWALDWAIKGQRVAGNAGATSVERRFAGFEYRRVRFPVRSWFVSDMVSWSVPCCPLAGVLAVGPAVRMARVGRYWWRMRRGLCAGCGYDLRHSPAGCPECGRGRAS